MDHERTLQAFKSQKKVLVPYLPLPLPWKSAFFSRKALKMVQTTDPEPVWDKPVDVLEKWIQFVDDNVLTSKRLSTVVISEVAIFII